MLSRLVLGKHATALGSLARIAFAWAAPNNSQLQVVTAAAAAATTAVATAEEEEDVIEIADTGSEGTVRTRVLGLSRNAVRLLGHVTKLMPTDEPLRMFEAEGILDEVFARLAALGRTPPPPPPPAPALPVEDALPLLPQWEAWLLACASGAASAAAGKVRITLAHLGIYALLERMQLLDVIGTKYPATHKLMTHIRQELKLGALEYDKLRLAALRAEAQALEARIAAMNTNQ